jgi:hypothetical protein
MFLKNGTAPHLLELYSVGVLINRNSNEVKIANPYEAQESDAMPNDVLD